MFAAVWLNRSSPYALPYRHWRMRGVHQRGLGVALAFVVEHRLFQRAELELIRLLARVEDSMASAESIFSSSAVCE